MNDQLPEKFLREVISLSKKLKPDLILFTGDFLCYGHLTHPTQLKNFLNSFSAPLGCFAVPGNHDYSQYVGVNAEGDYDLLKTLPSEPKKVFTRFFKKKKVTGRFSPRLKHIQENLELKNLLKETPFILLENTTVTIPIQNTFLNICGVGEYSAGRLLPERAFSTYDHRYPGIILCHNPDGVSLLENFPGELILAGHNHGGQVNLPGLIGRFMLVEHPEYRAGLYRLKERFLYVNRGLHGVLRFRFRASPEITLFTLGRACLSK